MALKILLAEDEEALSRVYKAALEHQGYEVDKKDSKAKKKIQPKPDSFCLSKLNSTRLCIK